MSARVGQVWSFAHVGHECVYLFVRSESGFGLARHNAKLILGPRGTAETLVVVEGTAPGRTLEDRSASEGKIKRIS